MDVIGFWASKLCYQLALKPAGQIGARHWGSHKIVLRKAPLINCHVVFSVPLTFGHLYSMRLGAVYDSLKIIPEKGTQFYNMDFVRAVTEQRRTDDVLVRLRRPADFVSPELCLSGLRHFVVRNQTLIFRQFHAAM